MNTSFVSITEKTNQQRQIRLLMVLLFIAFGFAFRISMAPAGPLDPHKPDLTGDMMMNYDIVSEIIGARSILDGSFSMYVGKYSADVVPPNGVALPYPPLTSYLQVPIVFVAQRFGVEPFSMTMMMLCGLLYVVLGGVLAWCAGKFLARTTHDELTATTVTMLLLFSSLMFWVSTYEARFELLAPLFLIPATTMLMGKRYGWAGFWNGLALMTKLTTLPATAVFAAVIGKAVLKREESPKGAVRFAIGASIPCLMLLPFVIAHPRALYDGLMVTPSLLPIMPESFINLLLQAGKHLFAEEPLRQLLKLYSNSIILALSFLFVALLVWRKDVRPGGSRFLALVALASFFLPVLAKYTYIHKYAALASIFVVLWGASHRRGFPHEAVWFVLLQSFILEHVPVIWKKYAGLIFYGIVFAYIFYRAFLEEDAGDAAGIDEDLYEKQRLG